MQLSLFYEKEIFIMMSFLKKLINKVDMIVSSDI